MLDVNIKSIKKDIKVPFGLAVDGRLKTPSEVHSGLACECVCPSCGESILAANKGKIQRPHFKHKGIRCSGGYESAVHLMAKEIIKDCGYIKTPKYEVEYSGKWIHKCHDWVGPISRVVFNSMKIDFTDVYLEQWLDAFRPDVVGVTKKGNKVAIEVVVTHDVDNKKLEAIKACDARVLKINLSHLHKENLSPDELKLKIKDIILSAEYTQWVWCPETVSARKSLIEEWNTNVRPSLIYEAKSWIYEKYLNFTPEKVIKNIKSCRGSLTKYQKALLANATATDAKQRFEKIKQVELNQLISELM